MIFFRVPSTAPEFPESESLELHVGHHFEKIKPNHHFASQSGAIAHHVAVPQRSRIPVDHDWHTITVRLAGFEGAVEIDGQPAYRFDVNTPQWRRRASQVDGMSPDHGRSREGHILLFPGHGPVDFRNMKVQRLPSGSGIDASWDQMSAAASDTKEKSPKSDGRRERPGEIVTRAARDGIDNQFDFATVQGLSFDMGLTNKRTGLASVGWRVKDYDRATVRFTSNGRFQTTATTFAGLLVDYRTSRGFSKRVAIAPDVRAVEPEAARVPWGAGGEPTETHVMPDVNRVGGTTYELELARYAPPDWTGESWVILHMNDTGPNTRLYGSVSFE